jgi:glycosyltransferase involved in cell wall biosynthesis
MRILFISRYFPGDLRTDVQGVYKRMNMFIDAIKEVASLDMLFYVSPDTDTSPSSVSKLECSLSRHWNTDIRLFLCPVSTLEYRGQLYKWWFYGTGIFNFFRQPYSHDMSGPRQIQAFEDCLSRKPDAIFAHRIFSMCPPLLTHKHLPPIFLDLDDIEHIVFRRVVGQIKRLRQKFLYLHVPVRFWGEYRAIRIAKLTFVCSEPDRRYLSNRLYLQNVVTVPNAVSIPELQPITEEPTLLFLGSAHLPNLFAAEFLIKYVWPYIHRRIPAARLIIAGLPPNKIRKTYHSIPGVEITGFVDDLEGLYKRTRVVCAPILSGGGTRIKIIEAAAYGKPIVSTRLGAEGIEMSDGGELLLRDDPSLFAEACLKLLVDISLCQRLGSAARATAVRYHDRNKVIQLIQRYLKEQGL